MSYSIYSVSQTNLIVIKLLHHSALESQAEYNHYFVVVIKTGAVQEYFLYKTLNAATHYFQGKVSLTQKL